MLENEGFECRFLFLGDYSLGKKSVSDYLHFVVNSLGLLPRFREVIARYEFDALYVGGTRALIWSAVVAKMLRVPAIWHIHNIFEDPRVRSLLGWFGKADSVREIVCVSQCVREQFPKLKGKSSVLYNAVDLERFKAAQCETVQSRNGPVLLAISNLQPVKRLEDLIAATSALIEKHPAAQVYIAGAERDETAVYAKRLKKLVSETGLEGKVLFLGHRDDIPELLGRADICVGMGREACPLFVLESFAAGTPVVGPDISGTKELIEKCGGGLVYPFGNVEQLGATLVHLVGTPSLREKFSLKAKRFAAECSMESFGEEVLRRFDLILKNS